MTNRQLTVSQGNEISNVAVIGAGTMGAAIAQHFLMKNLNVILLDVHQQGVDRGYARITQSLDEAIDRGIVTSEKKKSLLANLTCTTNYEALTESQFVVEAVFENIEVKQTVFIEIEKNVSVDCIIATNTSSLSITKLASVIQKQDRFLGVHYFYHAAKNKLIEIIPGENTAAEQVDRLVNFYFASDKTPIVVDDVYGFAINRFFVPWVNEAVRLYEEGLGSIGLIDKVAKDVFGVGMGPFALMNATGVPIALHVAEILETHFGSFYTPSNALKEQVKKGKEWDINSVDSDTRHIEEITNRLIASSLGVAAQMVNEGVTGVTETDLGARIGLQWPTGPFGMMNQIGIANVQRIISNVFEKYELQTPTLLSEIDKNIGFRLEHVKTHIIGSVGLLEFNRPDAMNALNPDMIVSLDNAFDELNENEDIERIILFSRSKAFVAGADVKFFVDNMENNDFENIYQFTLNAQTLFSRIANSNKKTIAYIDGIAMGGGIELALACDHRIATERLAVAFPEVGIGIYPGLGGTQRTTRLVGEGLAKYLIATGAKINAEQALNYGLIDLIVDRKYSLEQVASLQVQQTTATNCNVPEKIFEDFDGELNESLFEVEFFKKYEKSLKRKAPLALRKAMELIQIGSSLELDDALQLELESLKLIFSTKDAYAGLSAIINGKSPQFTGE
jgi:enoyl-CoA hydratase / 3-hydroxyacyl-CoA dehydrogenase